MPPLGVHSWLRPHGSASRTGFNSKKSAASSKNRHIREKLKQGGAALAARRLHRDARAHQDQRAHFRVRGTVLAKDRTRSRGLSRFGRTIEARMYLSETVCAGTAAEYDIIVLCPQRRYVMFEQTRAHFVKAGFHISKIKRREGIDLQKHPHIPRRQVITTYVLEYLRLELQQRFIQNPNLRYIMFAEDDCRLKRGTCAENVMQAALAAGPKIGWLGYYIRQGAPRYGCHVLSFSPASTTHIDELHKQHQKGGLPAFDTVLHHLASDNAEVIYVPPSPLASQAAHAFVGRR